MKYQILISSVAEAETDKIFLSISQRLSQEKAKEWYKGLLKAIQSLEKMPKRGVNEEGIFKTLVK